MKKDTRDLDTKIKEDGLESFDYVYQKYEKKRLHIPKFGTCQAPTGWGKTIVFFSAQINRYIHTAKKGRTRIINVVAPYLVLTQQNSHNIIHHLTLNDPEILKKGCLVINSSDSASHYVDDDIDETDNVSMNIEPYSNLENIIKNNLYDFVIMLSCNNSMGKHIRDLKKNLGKIDEYVLIDECQTVGNLPSKRVNEKKIIEPIEDKVYFDLNELKNWVESIIAISATPETWMIKLLNSFENPSKKYSMEKIIEISFQDAKKSERVIAPTDFIGIEVDDLNDVTERRDAIITALKIARAKGISVKMMLNNPYDTKSQKALCNELCTNRKVKIDNVYACSAEFGYELNEKAIKVTKNGKTTNGTIVDFCKRIEDDDSEYIVAQMGKMNAGVDIKPINCIFLNNLNGNLNEIAAITIQRIGRGTRTGSFRKDIVLVFFMYTKGTEDECWENVNILNKEYYNSNKMQFTLVHKVGRPTVRKLEAIPNERTFKFNKTIKNKFAVSMNELKSFQKGLKQFVTGFGFFRRVMEDLKEKCVTYVKGFLNEKYKSTIDFVGETNEHRCARKKVAKFLKMNEEDFED